VGHRADATRDAMPPRRVKQDMVKDVAPDVADVESDTTPGMKKDWKLVHEEGLEAGLTSSEDK